MHHVYNRNKNNKYSVAILIKKSAFQTDNIDKHYVKPLNDLGIARDSVIAFGLEYNANGKITVKAAKQYLSSLLPDLKTVGAKTILVADPNYYKVLTGVRKAEPHHGYINPCVIKDFEYLNIILSINYQALFHNPAIQTKLDLSIHTLVAQVKGTHIEIGSTVIHSAHYPNSYADIAATLKKLHEYPELSCDIETFSLKFWEAGIGSIAFAWDENNGVAFTVDYKVFAPSVNFTDNLENVYGVQETDLRIHDMLLEFFTTYKGKLTYHNGTFDIQILIFELFMNNTLDYSGLLRGLEVMCKNIDDTKLIAYLATNTTAGNKLGLKQLAFEHAGNYAEDEIHDIRKIQKYDLLKYNLIDCLCTNYVKKKYYPIMVQDQQETLYKEMFIPATKTIVHIQLTGMPIDMDKVYSLKRYLSRELGIYEAILLKSPIIKAFQWQMQRLAMIDANLLLKKKVRPIEDFKVTFNPGSGKQVRELLYDTLGFQVIDTTDTGLPATGAKTLKKLIYQTTNTEHIAILEALIEVAGIAKILSTFIKAFLENSVMKSDGMYYLHGNFNLTGTQSMRLSSSKPNLQNLPATSKYGKLIKECFVGPKGWIFGGADFNALEAVADALVTKDPNKIKVLADGYDGHCFNAFGYFPEKMPDIVNTLESINSIKKKYPTIRQDSKTITFAAQYFGTYKTFMENSGLSYDDAIMVEANYHKLYEVSDQWSEMMLQRGCKDGFVSLAFGGRLRTPILKQTILNTRETPYEAQGEYRSAGNALIQSYCILNTRAANEFMGRVYASEYALRIHPCALIHDAIYLKWEDDPLVTQWINKNLIECMEWSNLPELQHPKVKLGAELDVFLTSWADGITIPNNSVLSEIACLVHRPW